MVCAAGLLLPFDVGCADEVDCSLEEADIGGVRR